MARRSGHLVFHRCPNVGPDEPEPSASAPSAAVGKPEENGVDNTEDRGISPNSKRKDRSDRRSEERIFA